MDLGNMSPEEIAELQKKNCIFCKIIHKEIPSMEVYSDDKILAILDINPANEGHMILLPKSHYQIMPQMGDELISYLGVMAKRASKTLLKSLGAKGTSVFIANGAIAGQKAPHFMMHVIPRKNDSLFDLPKKAADPKKLEEIEKRLILRLGGKIKKETQEAKPKKEEPTEKEEKKEQEKIDIDKISRIFG